MAGEVQHALRYPAALPLIFSVLPHASHVRSLAPRDVDVASQTEEDSSLCEVLGRSQRAWLDRVLSASTAPVKVSLAAVRACLRQCLRCEHACSQA